MTGNGSGIREAVILSTCNRIEVYALTYERKENTSTLLLTMLSDWGRTSVDELAKHAYTLNDEAAASHLFAVASGLDSLVLGEQQIQLQVRNAVKISEEACASGRVLSELFHTADRFATRLRKEIGLGFDGSSVSSAAISLLTSHCQKANSLLIVGAGKMITVAADRLKATIHEILITNRTPQRAEALAKCMSGIPWPFDEIPSALERVDAVLTFTSSNEYVISAADISLAIQKRSNRELILIDGSVPRNIDPQAAVISGVQLYNIDDLAPFAGKIPEHKILEAGLMIDQEVSKFSTKFRSYQANDTLKELHQLAENIRQEELSRALNRMAKFSNRQKEIIDVLTRRIINKLLYEPTACVKEHAGRGDGESFDLIIRELFAISKENS